MTIFPIAAPMHTAWEPIWNSTNALYVRRTAKTSRHYVASTSDRMICSSTHWQMASWFIEKPGIQWALKCRPCGYAGIRHVHK